jgi:FdhD protein
MFNSPVIQRPVSQPGIAHLPVQKIMPDQGAFETEDPVAVEEPLEISLEYGPADSRRQQDVSLTMRTPGQDADLAIGFLFTEGILPNAAAIMSVYQKQPANNPAAAAVTQINSSTAATQPCNTILIALKDTITPDIQRLQRHFYTSSSCGVCGKTSIAALKTVCPAPAAGTAAPLEANILHHLPSLLRQGQDIFDSTGGLHAAGLFTYDGQLIALREDIGRHNAVDKLIGHALQTDQLPLTDTILLLSGRACFELIQKAAMAGIRIVAAVGPPSSLAVQMAEESDITLIGFLRQQRFNIYSGAHRIRI